MMVDDQFEPPTWMILLFKARIFVNLRPAVCQPLIKGSAKPHLLAYRMLKVSVSLRFLNHNSEIFALVNFAYPEDSVILYV